MKLLKPISLFFLVCVFFSCTSPIEPLDASIVIPVNPVPNPTPQSGDYFPTAINNSWTYSWVGNPDQVIKINSLDNIGAFSYYTFAPNNTLGSSGNVTPSVSRIRKANGNYFMKLDDVTTIIAPGFTATTTGRESTILKDNVPVNSTWNDDYTQTTIYNNPLIPPTTLNATVVLTIVEKGSSVTVNGQTFVDVIKVQNIQTIGSATIPSSTTTTFSWYAKNVGLVKTVSQGIGVSYEQLLKSYTLF